VNIRDITSEDADKQSLGSLRGVLITGTVPEGAAEAAGLKANDVITQFDGVDVNSTSELQVQVGKHRPGDKASVTFIRKGKETTVPIVLKNVAGNTSVVTADMNGEVVYGAKLAALGSSDKRDLNVDYGVKVMDLNDGKFKDLGIKKGYVILTVNGKKVKSASEVRQYTNGESSLKSIGGIQTDGTVFSYQFGN